MEREAEYLATYKDRRETRTCLCYGWNEKEALADFENYAGRNEMVSLEPTGKFWDEETGTVVS